MSSTAADASQHSRGRHAEQPHQIPAKGWRDILLRVKKELDEDNMSLVAAGVAFYALLAIFPALAALVSIYGLAAEPATVEQHVASLSAILPAEARSIITDQLHDIVTSTEGSLSIGLIGGLLLTLWSATKGTNALITAMNIAYDEQEKRGFLKLTMVSMLLTLGAVLFAVVALGLIVVLPAVLNFLGFPEGTERWIALLRWPLLGLFLVVALTVLYRYGPSRDKPRWHWVSWGAVIAAVLWLVGSALFSFYVSNFGGYNETYGSVGAVVILLMWFYLSAYIVLIAAEINAEMERQTKKDTTEGSPKPLGQRNAYAADTVGESPGISGESGTEQTARSGPAPQQSWRKASKQEDGNGEAAESQGKQAETAGPAHRAAPQTAAAQDHAARSLPTADELRQVARSLADLGRQARRNPLPALLAGTGIAWLLIAHLRDGAGHPPPGAYPDDKRQQP